MIVNLPVGHNYVAGRGICHRLGTGRREIDDGEPRIAEPEMSFWGAPFAAGIGSAMANQIQVERLGPA